MKFLMISTPAGDAAGKPPSPELQAGMQKLIEAETRSGVLVMTGGLLPPSMGGARLRSSGGKVTILDGPFAEAKEVVAGFAIIEVASRDEAIAASRRFFAVAGDGEGEIRPIMG